MLAPRCKYHRGIRMPEADMDLTGRDALNRLVASCFDAIGEVVVGQRPSIELLLVAVLCDGHVLIEDVPGTGKTSLAKALAGALHVSFRRIQFTPDLLPSDITGSSIYNQQTHAFEFRPGPLFGSVVLADEINRATPRTQSALLEAMEERQVTADGNSLPLPSPFIVLATQNPIELEGTFPLPEAQLDRFLFQLRLGYPALSDERVIVLRNARDASVPRVKPCWSAADVQRLRAQAARVHVADDVHTYLLELVRSTRACDELVLGASPRASIALYRAACALACLRGRDFVTPDDIKALAAPVLCHRLCLAHEARMAARTPAAILAQLIERIAVPVEA
jgi:MoxR-like ATPase